MPNWTYWEQEIRSFLKTGVISGHLGGTAAWRNVTNYCREALREVERLRAAPSLPAIAGATPAENPIEVVQEVITNWLEEIGIYQEPIDDVEVGSLFGMLGTAGYSIVPNAAATRSLSSLEGGPANQWVVVSLKEGRGLPYWRANSAGYADSITQAGFYSYEEAAKIAAGSHGDDEKYCIDDPTLADLISKQSYMRGKELALWVENAALKALSAHSVVEGGGAGVTEAMVSAALASTTPGEGPATLEQLIDAEGPEADRRIPGSFEQVLDFSGADTARRVVRAALEAAFAASPTTKKGQRDE